MTLRARINRSPASSADKELLRQLFVDAPNEATAILKTTRQPSSFSIDDRRALVKLAALYQTATTAAKDRAHTIISDMSCGGGIKQMLRQQFDLL